jgi:lipoprotein NlpI
VNAFDRAIEVDGWKSDAALSAAIYGNVAAREFGDAEPAAGYLGQATERGKAIWPRPIVDFPRGEIDEPTMISRAKTTGERTEARYFAGRALLTGGDVDAARKHWRWVADQGVKSFAAYSMAFQELERLDATTP